LSAIGDVINTIPALVALRRNFPQSFIGWAVEKKARDIVEPYLKDNYLNKVFILERQGNIINRISDAHKLVKELREYNFDIAVDFQGNLKSGFITYLSDAQTCIGMKPSKECNTLFTDHKIVLPKEPINRVARNLHIIQSLGIDTSVLKWEAIPPPFSPEDELFADEFISRNNPENKPLVVLHPGTSAFGIFKRWAPDKYTQLADKLIGSLNACCVISWGGREQDLAESIASKMTPKPVIAPEIITLNKSAAIFKKARLFIGSDSAPLHLANLVGTQVIGLYGPKDPVIYAPYYMGQPNKPIIVKKDLPCSPCKKRKCSDPACMESISVSDVLKEAVKILNC